MGYPSKTRKPQERNFLSRSGEFLIPANPFQLRLDRGTFERLIRLSKHGEEGVNWKFMNKKDLFPQTSIGRLEIPVPGRPGERILISKSAGNRAKWPFVTQRFAHWLLTHTTKRVSQKPIDFYFEVHDSTHALTF